MKTNPARTHPGPPVTGPRPGANRPPRPAMIVARVVRGVLAATVLAALLGGLPWALARYIGWPLPEHLPTWAEAQAALTTEMSSRVLIDALAVLCWAAWAAFVVDTIRAVPAAIRTAAHTMPSPDRAATGPIHAFTLVLITAIAVAVLTHRPAAEPATASPIATAADVPQDRLQPSAHTSARPADPAQPKVTVREPAGGVHDCLWRIAERELGDGARWPEIYQLNRGRPQPGGATLTNPDLIYPGWELLLPDDARPDA
ncbi:LysM peptidoglycan-binding domain-containing protein, partial [Phytoactinopolyspora endophytica]|uniref:LysM peptidoglycan-binding domain-containing protein n=1 Tax=Phytoactinopolyspora endophytica TaxID=1642495 RepID=UPI00197BB830